MLGEERPRRYFAVHYILLRFLGLGWWHHPDEGDTRNFFGWYLIYAIVTQTVWVVGFVGLETIDPFIGEKDKDKFMFSLSFVITHDLTVIKLCLFYFRNDQIQKIVQTLEIDLHDYYQNYTKTRKTMRIVRIMTASFLFFGWITIGNASTYGAYQDILWKAEKAKANSSAIPPRSLPQPIFIPWNYERDSSYIPTFALETVGLLWTGHIVMTIDTFIGALILHMSSQFSILQEALATAYDRTMYQLAKNVVPDFDAIADLSISNLNIRNRIVTSRYSKKEIDAALESTFRKCFIQHQVLISCVKEFSKTYAYGFMTQLLSSMAAICVVMVQVSQDASSFKSIRLVTSLSFFLAMTLQLFIQCYAGNELTIEAGKVSSAVMECKWEFLTPRLRRMLLLVMMRAQRPIRLHAAGFTHIDNACFFAIMKAAYSYYAVLSQKQGKSNV